MCLCTGKFVLVQNLTSVDGNTVNMTQPAPASAQPTASVLEGHPPIPYDVFQEFYDDVLRIKAGVRLALFLFAPFNAYPLQKKIG